MTSNKISADYRQSVNSAVELGVERYIASRKSMAPSFVQRHFSFKGSVSLHKQALGKDLLLVPFNILWSVVKLIAVILAVIGRQLGCQSVATALAKVPAGFETNTAKEINWLIYSQLLEFPFDYRDKHCDRDALLDEIMKDERLRSAVSDYIYQIEQQQDRPDFQKNLNKKLQEYTTTRVATAELASNVLLFISSYSTLGRASFGALGVGNIISASIAHSLAVSSFWLGPAIGGWYYSIVPVTVSLGLIIPVLMLMIVIVAFLSTFIGIITDPLQSALGLHQKRLLKLIESLHAELLSKENTRYHLKEKYCARVFDVLDILAMAGRGVS